MKITPTIATATIAARLLVDAAESCQRNAEALQESLKDPKLTGESRVVWPLNQVGRAEVERARAINENSNMQLRALAQEIWDQAIKEWSPRGQK